MRLFAALPLPAFATDRLSALRLRLAMPHDGLRWTSPEQWHITLQFFGDVPATQAQDIGATLRRFTGEPVEIRLEELGRFAAKGILYAAIMPSAELAERQRALTAHMSLAGVAPPVLPFHPHITLARSKGRAGLKTLQALSTPALPSLGQPLRWTASALHLYESVLGSHGASYELIAEVPLAAAQGSAAASSAL